MSHEQKRYKRDDKEERKTETQNKKRRREIFVLAAFMKNTVEKLLRPEQAGLVNEVSPTNIDKTENTCCTMSGRPYVLLAPTIHRTLTSRAKNPQLIHEYDRNSDKQTKKQAKFKSNGKTHRNCSRTNCTAEMTLSGAKITVNTNNTKNENYAHRTLAHEQK